ncbi:hypothetical protein L3Q82_026895 [Scortum barcoo]|uniref:Uncharacterized protein n=1 Tax=Scortum barcoo TaxID=214431 RepID=A0ACB8WJU9_9TELE|nr:hypothetical protein L3Q82_026895 [Scortum barcoo]
MPDTTTSLTFSRLSRKITTAPFIREADFTLPYPTTSPTAKETSSTGAADRRHQFDSMMACQLLKLGRGLSHGILPKPRPIVANLFNVKVPLSVKKDELRQFLVERLGETGLFADQSTAEVAAKADMEIRDPVPPVTPAPKDTPVLPGMSADELQLTLRIKELEVRNRELEVEAMHLRNFASVVAPLTSLVSPNRQFVWTVACQDSFHSAKALLCNAPILVAPDFARPFKIEVDASAYGAGAVLLQEDDHGIDHPVCYFSKKFNKQQLNYSTIEKEALVLLLSLQHFEVYVGLSSTLDNQDPARDVKIFEM